MHTPVPEDGLPMCQFCVQPLSCTNAAATDLPVSEPYTLKCASYRFTPSAPPNCGLLGTKSPGCCAGEPSGFHHCPRAGNALSPDTSTIVPSENSAVHFALGSATVICCRRGWVIMRLAAYLIVPTDTSKAAALPTIAATFLPVMTAITPL